MEDKSLETIVQRRAKPRVMFLDEALHIAFAEPEAADMLLRVSSSSDGEAHRLPHVLEDAVAAVVDGWRQAGQEREAVIRPVPSLVLRVSRLAGTAGSYVAVFIEHGTRREDLTGTAQRYGLTRREVEVLTLILNGLSGGEIAQNLSIAETTVADYVKQLLRKTGAKNRADMLARVLGWNGTREANFL